MKKKLIALIIALALAVVLTIALSACSKTNLASDLNNLSGEEFNPEEKEEEKKPDILPPQKNEIVVDGLRYELIDNGTAWRVIGSELPSNAPINIPNYISQNPVKEIGASAFAGDGNTEITIPETVISIGYYVFFRCANLTTITVAAANPVYRSEGQCIITKEGGVLIAGCRSSVIPNSGVTAIREHAFSYCTGLTSLSIPSTVTSIGEGAFEGCSALTSMTFPTSVTAIADTTFNGCTALTTFNISSTVTSIGSSVFDNSGLKTLTCDGANTYFSAQNGVLYNKSQNAIVCVPAGLSGEIVIPNAVTSIGDYAFEGRVNLTKVTLGSGVSSIGVRAFAGTGVVEFVVDGNNPNYASNNTNDTVDKGVIYNKAKTAIVAVPVRLMGIFTVISTVTTISAYGFDGCGLLTVINIGTQVTTVGSNAFRDCALATLNCSAASKPSGWASDYNPANLPVTFNTRDGSSFAKAMPISLNNPERIVINTAGRYYYFAFTATANASYTIYTEMDTSFDTYLHFYNKDQVQVTTADDENGNMQPRLTRTLVQNETYYFAIRAYSSTNSTTYPTRVYLTYHTTGNGLSFDAPLPLKVRTPSQSVTIDTVGKCYYFLIVPEITSTYVIYSLTPAGFDTYGELFGSYDHTIGASGGRLTYNDDGNSSMSGGSMQPRITYFLTAGQVYYFRFRHYSGDNGSSSTSNPSTVYLDYASGVGYNVAAYTPGRDGLGAFEYSLHWINYPAGQSTSYYTQSLTATLDVATKEVYVLYCPIENGTFRFTTTMGVSFDTYGYLYRYDAGGCVQVAYNDDGGGNSQPLIDFYCYAGTVYYFKIKAYSTTGTNTNPVAIYISKI